ncbi:peptidylprolyl isomerase FKBP-type [Pseudopedobacter saltans DSM 12145]|uniref:Peptidyl-prolyl cis-trans isomerase n=1 Tax=Pseudopedobacter saltans (strain ATCC 51119 / DSM 12145 / JCM 21818 / CCUG 39354 / LMG 10337 / NBRC 100064 / NCIMB 13643) TaxID=762903 RepID=F0S5H9_PSESL|nr:FKBP-type peptidyl-prolyl cis-trans isomerase [Pseudopedobacter saltans]ADY53143.1 peptidylprolyl isomerase FKBP-type [Pseudopedobacter saltans DSM 12145]
MRKLLVYVVVVSSMFIFGSCLKTEDTPNYQQQMQDQLNSEEMIISRFLVEKNIAATRDATGIYFYKYEQNKDRNEKYNYTPNTIITVKYTGRLLNGTVFDSREQETNFRLGEVIFGWQVGIQLMQKGEKLRLIIPSVYGYGNKSLGLIPANSILDFDIELIDIK